jgi:hypothetical protein
MVSGQTSRLEGQCVAVSRRASMSASLIGRLRSSAFRLSTTAASASLAGSCFSSDSAQGPSIMGSEDKVEQSLGRPCPMAGPSGHANSPHPSSREGRHSTAWWSSKYPPIAFDPERTSYRCSFSGPSELAAISPDAVHNDGQASRKCNDCLFHSAVLGNLHRPGLEP